jgi:hypothetical protein
MPCCWTLSCDLSSQLEKDCRGTLGHRTLRRALEELLRVVEELFEFAGQLVARLLRLLREFRIEFTAGSSDAAVIVVLRDLLLSQHLLVGSDASVVFGIERRRLIVMEGLDLLLSFGLDPQSLVRILLGEILYLTIRVGRDAALRACKISLTLLENLTASGLSRRILPYVSSNRRCSSRRALSPSA